MMNRKLKKSLDFANKENIPYVIIVGENELINNKVIIKDMFNNSSIELDLDKIDDINTILKRDLLSLFFTLTKNNNILLQNY